MKRRFASLTVTASAGFLFCALRANVATADPLGQVTVHLNAPAPCPTAETLHAELRRDLEGSRVPGEPLDVDVRIFRLKTDEWQAKVHAQRQKGNSDRVLTARDCGSLLDAASLIIAMLIDPETAAVNARTVPTAVASLPDAPADAPPSVSVPTPPSASVPTPPSVSVPTPPSVSVPTPNTVTAPNAVAAPSKPNPLPSPSSAKIGGLLGALSAADYGSLPSTTVAFGGSAALTYARLRVETTLGWWWPKDKTFPKGAAASASAKFSMTAAAGKLCARLLQVDALTLNPCAGVQAAHLAATASNLAEPQPTSRWDWSVVAGALTTYEFAKRLAIRGNFDVLLPVKPPRFGFYENGTPTEVFRPAKVPLRATIGLECRFF